MRQKIKNFLNRLLTAETSYSRWCKVVLITCISVIAATVLLVFLVDPHYRYHKPLFYDTVYHKAYATVPGLLKFHDFDLLMLGTSMVRNFFISDIEHAFGGKAFKISAAGGSMKDQRTFFELAAKEKGDRLKRVVFSLDVYSLNKDRHYCAEYDYLYSDGHGEDYRYFFSRDTFSTMIYLLKRKFRPKRARIHETNPDRMFSKEYDGSRYSLREVVSDAAGCIRTHHTPTPYDPAISEKSLREELLPIFDENPQISFTVYLPPYHIYTYCLSEHFGEADALIKQRTTVLKELLKRKNVKLYDFQTDRALVCDTSFFGDIQHFSSRAAKIVLDSLQTDRRRLLTEADILKNEAELRTLTAEKMADFRKDLDEYSRTRRKK